MTFDALNVFVLYVLKHDAKNDERAWRPKKKGRRHGEYLKRKEEFGQRDNEVENRKHAIQQEIWKGTVIFFLSDLLLISGFSSIFLISSFHVKSLLKFDVI